MWRILIIINFCIIHYGIINGQYNFSAGLRLDTYDVNTQEACYHLIIKNESIMSWGIAGQNYRIFYNSRDFSFLQSQSMSLLPAPVYTPFTLVSNVENIIATGTGDLPFEDDLGFLNFFIDLNNTQSGAVNIAPDSTLVVARLCFKVVGDHLCSHILFANRTLTLPYANAFNEVSVWTGPNITIGGTEVEAETQNILPIDNIIINGASPTNCPLLDNGTLSIQASQANFWNLNAGMHMSLDSTLVNLGAGLYNITVGSNITGCTLDTTITLTAPSCTEICNDGIDNDGDGEIDCADGDCGRPSILSLMVENPTLASCPELNDGRITVNGTSVTRYSIDGGASYQAVNQFIGLTGGVYNIVLINDATGCTQDTTITLTAPSCAEICNDGIDNDGDGDIDCEDGDCGNPSILSLMGQNPTQASCPDLNDGRITVNGTSVTRYSIDGGASYQAANQFIGLTGGVYNILLINDATGCTQDTTITLTAPSCAEICNDGIDNDGDGDIDCADGDCGNPTIISLMVQNPTQASCPDLNDGRITVSGTSVTRYSIDGGASYQAANQFIGLTGGVYNIVLINDATGCTQDTTITLAAPGCNEICNDGIDNDGDGEIDCADGDCGMPEISSLVIQNPTQASCPDLNDGRITVAGTSVTRYSIDGGSYQTSGQFVGLTGGNYNIELINDATGCSQDTTITLTAPSCTEICNDGIDNDGDGQIDCADGDCACPKDLFVYPNVFRPRSENAANRLFYFYIDQNRIESVVSWQIFDRYGNMVYENKTSSSSEKSEEWDGVLNGNYVSQGVYVIKISYKEIGVSSLQYKVISVTVL